MSVAVSLGARNLMTAYCEAQHRLAADDRAAAFAAGPGSAPASALASADLTNRLLDFLASPRGQQLAVLTVTAFVSSGMRSYLDQTLDLNFYEVRCPLFHWLPLPCPCLTPLDAGRLLWLSGLLGVRRAAAVSAANPHLTQTPLAPAPPSAAPCRTCLPPWPSRSTWRQ